MSSYVLYHDNCPDGFGSAWAAWTALEDSAEYIPVLYGKPPPDLAQGNPVSIIDFSYPRQVLLDLHARHPSLHVLDHHKTAKADLAGLDFCLFDMDKSGAMLAWEHWHPDEEPPRLIRYVQDRDLWRFELPNSREISAWLQSYPYQFELWSALAEQLNSDFTRTVTEGKAILRAKKQQVELMCKHARMVEVGGHTVPIANATVFFSEVGELLCQLHPEAPFAGYYFDRSDGTQQWGLRSQGDFDVSEVAKSYGGGGHQGAAGFEVVRAEGFEPSSERLKGARSSR